MACVSAGLTFVLQVLHSAAPLEIKPSSESAQNQDPGSVRDLGYNVLYSAHCKARGVRGSRART